MGEKPISMILHGPLRLRSADLLFLVVRDLDFFNAAILPCLMLDGGVNCCVCLGRTGKRDVYVDRYPECRRGV